MYILGVNISHHPSIALLHDNELIYYIEDDRYNKNKEEEWISDSNIECLKDLLVFTKHIDHVIFASYGKSRIYDLTPHSDLDAIKDFKNRPIIIIFIPT